MPTACVVELKASCACQQQQSEIIIMSVKSSEIVLEKKKPKLTPAEQIEQNQNLRYAYGAAFICHGFMATLTGYSLWNDWTYSMTNVKIVCLSYFSLCVVLSIIGSILGEIETIRLKKTIERTNKSTSPEDISRIEKGPPPPTYESVNLINVPPPTYQDAILLS